MNKGSFKPGHTPHNKGKKMLDYVSEKSIAKIKETQFKTDEQVAEKHRKWKGGVQTMNNDVIHLYNGKNQRVRRPKKVYEDKHGPIPKNWLIYHLNGQKHDDSLENLIAIPRSTLMKINSGQLNANYHEIKTDVETFIKNQNESHNNITRKIV